MKMSFQSADDNTKAVDEALGNNATMGMMGGSVCDAGNNAAKGNGILLGCW